MSARGGPFGKTGRGMYYKELYGRRTSSHPSVNPSHQTQSFLDDFLSRGPAELGKFIGSKDALERELHRIDGKPYGAYNDLKGISLLL